MAIEEGTLIAPVSMEAAVSIPRRFSVRTTFDESTIPNLSDLSERLVGDALVAASVTACIAPALTVVDKALVQRATGQQSVIGSALGSMTSMLRNPVGYFRSPAFMWMWMTYASTYTVANSLRTLTEYREHTVASATDNLSEDQRRLASERHSQSTTATLFVGTTIMNSSASLVKDRAYARMFGAATAQSVVPRMSYALWVTRDITVIGSSFILPDHVSRFMQDKCDMKCDEAAKIAQLGTPLAAQLIAGPLHFLGLDMFNRNLVATQPTMTLAQRASSRASFLKAAYIEVCAARMARILPGYGIAGVWNTQLRNQWRDMLIKRKVASMMQKVPDNSTTLNRASPGDVVALIQAKKAS